MKKFSVVLAVVALLGFLLAWNPGFSEAAVRVPSGAQDPAQLATASILPVKGSSKTDTILILFRDKNDAAGATGQDIKLVFYTTACTASKDATVNLTQADVDLGDETRAWVSTLFALSTPASGVILGTPVTTSADFRWAMSGLVVDMDIGALYERQSYPALVAQSQTNGQLYSYWAGFSDATFTDFYLQGSGFVTTVQLVCPTGGLQTAMTAIAPFTAATLGDINIYDRSEGLKNSIHGATCTCWTEDPGTMSSVMKTNTDILGFFEIKVSSGYATGSRVINVTGTGYYIDGRIRRATGTAVP